MPQRLGRLLLARVVLAVHGLAFAVEHERVLGQIETGFLRHVALTLLHFVIEEFLDLAAFHADQMVVRALFQFEQRVAVFEVVTDGALDIEIFAADHTAFSKKLGKVVMMRDVPDHSKEDFVLLSGTKVREMLGNGTAPPPEFSRPEVAEILMEYYQSKQA